MDIVTQTVLGAGIGEVVLGKKAGNKALMWGAVGGLIPDMDVLFTRFYSVADGLFVHRGFSHSLVFAFLMAPIMGWLIHRIHRKKMLITRIEWTQLMFWSIFTHPLLDYLTTYGTGAFLPFSSYRVELGTIGIVDVFYTLPFLLALLTLPFFNRKSKIRRYLMVGTLALTTGYLSLTVANKFYVNKVFEQAFKAQDISYERFRTSPLPLSNFLWMGIAEASDGYHMALYSNFDEHHPTDFIYIPRNEHLLAPLSHDTDLQKLLLFTKGYYQVGKDTEGLYLADLRFGKMGIDETADYIFKFYLTADNQRVIINQARKSGEIDKGAFSAFLQRIKGI
ncbi:MULTISPECIES: metal-dependent hydrolase [unclassified Carboxylicivirga]|uniref:metal-dependent hydrolase n=1 Tax=Carboxylicivirga TaxID=1628153 RepID=UPI003D348F27